ncbi:MAG: hypothetical protein HLX50_01800 [Alteromonadaceae bacterium]|nr:hypothetical protein [Alteromonadaceae bacterium]
MNVFILCTGRCGSTTFSKACKYISNYTASHESRCKFIGSGRFEYPNNHIEVDNRLSWLLGRLDKEFGNSAFYVHLKRNREQVAESFTRRYAGGIIKAYRGSGIIMGLPEETSPMSVALDYCDTIDSNIELFLKDKSQKMDFWLESYANDFAKFWQAIGAEGDLERALSEFSVMHNAS